MNITCRIFPLLVAFFLISACEYFDNSEENLAVVLPDISAAPLKQVESESDFEMYLKNGLRLTNVIGEAERADAEINVAADEVALTSDSSAENFSTTNTQEAGVDEADKIEYDGEFLYVLTHSDYYWYIDFGGVVLEPLIDTVGVSSSDLLPPNRPPEEISPPGVRVMQRGENASMNEIAWLEIDNRNGFDGLYLAEDVLAALSVTYGSVETISIDNDVWYWGKPRTRLDLLDVSTPAEINIRHTIELDGHLVSSRRIDNQLILITKYTPDLPGFSPYPITTDQTSSNQALLDNAGLNDLLPKKIIDGEISPMLVAADCYVYQDLPENAGYASLTVVSIINMEAPDEFTSSCFNGVSHGVYASTQSLYINASDDYNETVIHKFAIDGPRPLYLASGSVPGNLGWRNPAYRLSESGDDLRVISTQRNDAGELEHYLTILQDNKQGQLQQISQLPNELHTEKIGKPGEDIQSVRYFQDRAYIVTFLRTDPLYVIDVSDATAPSILGELEIPGFSSYLHPVNENLLLGFGQQNWADSKMSLFDVSNPNQPIEIKNFIWQNTSTPLRWDPHALAIVETEQNHFRFTFPIESWVDYTSDSGLYLFDLVIDNDVVNLAEPALLPVTTDNTRGYAYGYNQRSVIHADEVHYVHDHRVWSANWDLSVINSQQ